jgi:hypothetical protein
MNCENLLTKLCVELGIARPCGRQFDQLFGCLDGHWGDHFGTVDYPRGRDGVFTDKKSADYIGKRSLSNDCFNRNGRGVKYDLFFYESQSFVDIKEKDPAKEWGRDGLEVTMLGSTSKSKIEDVYNTILSRGYAFLFVWKDEGGATCLQALDALQYCKASQRGLKSVAKKKRGLELKIRERDAYANASSPVVKLTGIELVDRAQILGLVDFLNNPPE